MKYVAMIVMGALVLCSADSAMSYVKIPSPPKSGTARVHGMTRQRCFEQAHGIRVERIRRGYNRRSANRVWVRQVERCKTLPKKLSFEPSPGTGSPKPPTVTGTGGRWV